ncbi:YfiR family protein [Microbulbifer variabilis]|uniref:YfiR family protein n=1 Tax=Microbulbifer variabilis TaxID=266805 RepID=A0ABY4VFV9_9GAMM|nr:YfiR family protein [Microbulbifer variabilis]USD20829.1 YfiR family protein [Microbulbifer variabilis]
MAGLFAGAPFEPRQWLIAQVSADRHFLPEPRLPPAEGVNSRVSMTVKTLFARLSITRPFLTISLILSLLLAPLVQAAVHLSDTPLGRRVMVDYIVHFAYNLQWPVNAFDNYSAPFKVCLMGGDSLGEQLALRFKNQRIDGRRVALEKIGFKDILRARKCQIVVLGSMDRSSLLKTLVTVEFFPVLTVSDAERFAATGGMIEFADKGGEVALRMNKTMLEKAELKMGNSLFRLGQKLE